MIGWILYHLVYPVWRLLLAKIHAYPKFRVHEEISKLIGDGGMNARDIWSYFLWDRCSPEARQRVKSLADYGHSLYLTSFTFIVLPFFYGFIKIVISYETIMDHILFIFTGSSLQPSGLGFVESIFLVFSMLVGIALVFAGRNKLEYVANLQWIILVSKKKELEKFVGQLIPNAKLAKSK